MPNIACPRCRTVIEKPAHGNPVCPKCGFGAPAAAAPGYAAPPSFVGAPPGMVAQPPTNGKATTALVLGIIGLCLFGIILGPIAIVLGNSARKEIRASHGRQTGDGLALAGIIMGWVAVGSFILFVLWFIFVFSLAAL